MTRKHIDIDTQQQHQSAPDITSSPKLMITVLGSHQEASLALNAGYDSKDTYEWSMERLRQYDNGVDIADLPSAVQWFNLVVETDPEAIVDEINAVEFEKNIRLQKEAVR